MRRSLFVRAAMIAGMVFYIQPCLAEMIQVFNLKDGSIIKGRLTSFAQGVYTIQSDQLGKLQIPADRVATITHTNEQNRPAPQTPSSPSSPPPLSPELSRQVGRAQSDIMSNPAVMREIEKIADDKEFAALLADPGLRSELEAALSHNDPRLVENNPKLKKILQDPRIQNLLREMSSGSALPPR